MEKITKQANAYYDYCERIRRMSPVTLASKKNTIARFVKETKLASLEQLDNATYNAWVADELARGIAPQSMNIYNSAVLALVRFHRDGGLAIPLNLNAVPHFKSTRTMRKFYTAAEIHQIIRYAAEPENLMIEIMFETGMRIAELVRLRTDNIDNTKITFIGKGGKLREVYIRKETEAKLQEYCRKYNIDGHIWCVVDGAKTQNCEPPTVNTMRTKLRQAFERAGFSGFYPHALRHSFATDLQLKGATVPETKEMLGHENIATTERYLHGFDNQLEALFRKYR